MTNLNLKINSNKHCSIRYGIAYVSYKRTLQCKKFSIYGVIITVPFLFIIRWPTKFCGKWFENIWFKIIKTISDITQTYEKYS